MQVWGGGWVPANPRLPWGEFGGGRVVTYHGHVATYKRHLALTVVVVLRNVHVPALTLLHV